MRRALLYRWLALVPLLVSTVGGNAVLGAEHTAVFSRTEKVRTPDRLRLTSLARLPQPSRAQAAGWLSTVSVTPDGSVSTAPADAADVTLLLQTIAKLKAAPPTERSARNETLHPKSVIGRDTRERVKSTTLWPYRAIGDLDVGCSGTLVGPHHVLTAGHCVYSPEFQEWYGDLDFQPARNGSKLPYGSVHWRRALVANGWVSQGLRDLDYALVILSQDVGRRTGMLPIAYNGLRIGGALTIAGYPADEPAGTMWRSACSLAQFRASRLYYDCDTAPGSSGSPVYGLRGTWPVIYGVHGYGIEDDPTGLNGATRLTRTTYDTIKGWIAKY